MSGTVTTKRCTKCGETKSVDGFSKDSNRRDGLQPSCKECYRAYYKANREKALARSLAYRKANPERVAEMNRERYELHGNPTSDRYRETTERNATRFGRWMEAEDRYLIASTERVVDDALALRRTYSSVSGRLHTLRARGVILARDTA